jgi:hypothetical protein
VEYQALKQLTNAFSVREIMTNANALRRADTLEDARHLFKAYDVVPYPRQREIEGFFRSDSDDVFPIEIENLISGGTPLLEVPELVSQRRFYFVMSTHTIDGYVHYSDLNKTIAKIPFFAMFQSVERQLWDRFSHRITDDDVRELFRGEAEGFITKQKQNVARNVDLEWTGVFSFPRILRMARFYGLIHLTNDEIELLRVTRNKVAHSDHNLVDTFGDVVELAKSADLFWSLLDYQ